MLCIDDATSEESGHPGRLANHPIKRSNLVPKKVLGEMRVLLRSMSDITFCGLWSVENGFVLMQVCWDVFNQEEADIRTIEECGVLNCVPLLLLNVQ